LKCFLSQGPNVNLRRSLKLAAFVALAGPPDLLARYRAPLLTAQKIANLHDALPKLAAFLKDFRHSGKKYRGMMR